MKNLDLDFVLTKESAKERIDFFINELNNVYVDIKSWMPWNDDSYQTHESTVGIVDISILKSLNMERVKLPTLTFLKKKCRFAFVPSNVFIKDFLGSLVFATNKSQKLFYLTEINNSFYWVHYPSDISKTAIKLNETFFVNELIEVDNSENN